MDGSKAPGLNLTNREQITNITIAMFHAWTLNEAQSRKEQGAVVRGWGSPLHPLPGSWELLCSHWHMLVTSTTVLDVS